MHPIVGYRWIPDIWCTYVRIYKQATMMKMNKHISGFASVAMLLTMLVAGATKVAAQEECYTLTNGILSWYEYATWNPQAYTANDPAFNHITQDTTIGRDEAWNELHLPDGNHTTLITHQQTDVNANRYLRLDIETDPAHPAAVATNTFDVYCVWHRTGNTGYYYQEHNGTFYYLIGSKNGLEIATVEPGDPTDMMSTWFNWDFGAAVKEVYFRDGARKENYYWLMYDSTSSEWRMSCNSYERPETMIYTNYQFSGANATLNNQLSKRYYCNLDDNAGDGNFEPAGRGALVLPVTVTFHPKALFNPPAGYGLATPTLDMVDGEGASTTRLGISGEATVNVVLNESTSPIDNLVTPEYYHYYEEVYRYGINTNWRARNSTEFGSAGLDSIMRNYYLYNGTLNHDANFTTAAAPAPQSSDLVVEKITYKLSPSAYRFLKFNINGVDINQPGQQTVTRPDASTPWTTWMPDVKLKCFNVPTRGSVPTLTISVTFTNGVVQTQNIQIDVTSDYVPKDMPTAANSPVIHGAVFGGGRMANVGGNTNITIHNADSIYAVYGGNDIAGWVQGDGGATIQIGTEKTSQTAPVKIGWVYGGGCGYYSYRGITFSATHGYPYMPGTNRYGINYQNYYFGNETHQGFVYPWGTVPTWGGTDPMPDTIKAGDTANLVWPSRAIASGFHYRPVTHDPDHVDISEDGNGGNGTIPYIKTSHIIIGAPNENHVNDIHNDYIVIDSLYGGAENAFIGVTSSEETPNNAITIDINGGTIFTVFGGNNYGGAVANTSTVMVKVHDTKLPPVLAKTSGGDSLSVVTGYPVLQPTSDISFFGGFGRDYGIRYLFGGGNLVDGSHAYVEINGGIIDTVFGGGNSATVHLPWVKVNCAGANFICENPSYDKTNPDFGLDNLTGEIGNYNVRTVFGGNNKADMTTLSYVELVSGGVSTVYGGGNMGDMLNESTISRPNLLALMGQTLTNSQIKSPIAVGSIVYTPQNSNIVCDYAYGGCRMANVKHSSGCVLYGGLFGYVYGGNDISGDVGSTIATTVVGDHGYRDGAYVFLAGNVEIVGDAVGGSDGYYHCDSLGVYYMDDDIFDNYNGVTNYDPYHEYSGKSLPTHNNTTVAMFDSDPDPDVFPQVYGNITTGGTHSNVGFDEGVNYDVTPADDIKNGSTTLSLLGGKVHGNVFGGGYMSSVYGLGYIHVGGTQIIEGSLFAGNDLVGSVEPFHAYTFSGVPDEASYMAAKTSNGINLNVKEGSSWSPIYSCYVKLDGTPTINKVYGGGNGAYDYDGNRPEYDLPSLCISTAGGVNRPLQSSSFIDINVEGGRIDTVFGGGNGVGVQNNVMVLLNAQNNSGEYVGTIFGGNNRDDMVTCVPDILLTNGQVGDVYGGGNAGSMRASYEFSDVCGNMITGISTHIRIDNTSLAQVNGSIYGGCRMANVTGMAYIEIHGGNTVNNVYGGNDISGTVSGNTRIDVSGGTVKNIFGGSNGKYDYVQTSQIYDSNGVQLTRQVYNIYEFDSDHSNDDNVIALNHLTGRPFVDSTTVNLYGGDIMTDVYGGGNLGDCRLTLVEVNNQVCGERTLNIHGTIYGGGRGIDDRLNAERHGNVMTPLTDDKPSRTHVNLRHATLLQSDDGKVRAYGGGRGGDVMDTYITAFSTWGTPFDEIYGGCWGSDVYGTTHLVLNGSDDPNAMTAQNVYGGNDFTGVAGATEIAINGGRYANIFGGGRGEEGDDTTLYHGGVYVDTDGDPSTPAVFQASTGADSLYAGTYTEYDKKWNSNVVIGQPRRIYAPNTEYTVINFNDGTVTGNLYGGGRQGTTMRYKRDANGQWITQAGGAARMPDTFRSIVDGDGNPYPSGTSADLLPNTNALEYSHIIINVKNGTFEHNIYGGGMGREGGPWIVYGLKEVNIENGLVKESVYGGSENVSDGYPNECISTDVTTMRPSSILNITGGTIKNNVYGGGYLGDVYGSVYVNVGIEAVENCVLWSKTIYDIDSAYINFKPGFTGSSALVGAMETNELQLQASIYAGANWGNNVGSADFSKQGFYGGESRVLVDGEGYNTYMDSDHESLDLMNIVHSILGSGTSASGGDIYSRVDVRNYGAVNPGTCHPTRQLKAIQRTDGLWLENTAINFTGATDAISAYLSQQFTLNRIDTINCVGYNVVDIDATMTNVANVNFLYNKAYSDYLFDESSDPGNNYKPAIARTTEWFEPSLTYMYVPIGYIPLAEKCDANATICEKLDPTIINRNVDANSITALVINNGINVDIIGEDGGYGAIRGFGMMLAQAQTNAVVTARAKFETYTDGSSVVHNGNPSDGGFVSSCSDDLKAIKEYGDNHVSIEWCDCFENLAPVAANDSYCNVPDGTGADQTNWLYNKAEYPYSNYGEVYRVWKLGNGTRRRYAVIQAHSNPDLMYSLADESLGDVDGNRVYSNKKITLRYKEGEAGHDSVYNLCMAYAKLVLPPTTPGNYYKITEDGGITMEDENEEMRLTDVSFNPKWDQLTNTWTLSSPVTAKGYATGDTYEATGTAATDHGKWDELTLSSGDPIGANNIYNYPGGKQFFGLMMTSGANFGTDGPNYAGASWEDGTTISGSPYTSLIQDYATAQVGSTVNASPELDFYMLYDNRFSHTLVGTITFTLDEHKSVPRRANYHETDGGGNAIENPISTNTGAIWLNGTDTVWLDSSLNAPIIVELTITTILQDFTNMDYEVLAMYNEGRSNTFSRKVVLPATLQQRELYLDSIAWFPTDIHDKANGDTIRTATIQDNHGGEPKVPDWFFLTDDMNKIKNQDATKHSYFGMTVQPTDNVSNTLVTAVSWHTISQTEPLDLFSAGYAPGTVPTDPERAYNNQYYQEAGSNPTHKIGVRSLIDVDNAPHGIKLGNLDGRGDAALNVTLKYDGMRVYEKLGGKGYVGKVVLYLKSYVGGQYDDPNPFTVTINVKTREHGDTIYLASEDYFDEEGGTKHTIPGTSYYAEVCSNSSWTAADAGKNPHSCATTFYDALTKVYQEGDVIAILGEVKIGAGKQELIKGQEYMPIPVIRYEGHHNMMPGEACVYRGPMITVEGTPNNQASFTARCIEFKGSMVAKTEPSSADGTMVGNRINPTTAFTDNHPLVYNMVDANDYKYADTNVAYGPIIRVKGNGTVNLQHGVTVHENYNAYWTHANCASHSSSTFDPSMMGAISVTNGGVLNIKNKVDIKNNFSSDTTSTDRNDADWHIKPEGGAVYVDGGRIYLPESHNTTAIHIDSNYLFDGTPFWAEYYVEVESVDKLVHYEVNNSVADNGYYADNDNHRLANVFLARYEVASVPDDITALGSVAVQTYKDTHDFRSNVIIFDEAIPEGTRIGITKWFPDKNEAVRDTIQIVYQADGTYLQEAAFNGNFTSDDHKYYTFYNYGVNNQRIYLARCATFKYQLAGNYLVGDASYGVATGDALSYRPLSGASCPIGGDSLIVRAQGGFFPYTYTWYDPGTNFTNPADDVVRQTRKTKGTNNEVNKQTAMPDYTMLANAVADTILTENINMPYSSSDTTIRFIVTTTDATGGCKLTKNVEIKLKKDHSVPAPDDFIKTGTTSVWTEQDAPNTVNANNSTGDRNYRSVLITPMVWSPGSGTIAVTSNKTPNIYIIDGNTMPEVESLHFCEGDLLSLVTEPKFHMEVVLDEHGDPVLNGSDTVKQRVDEAKFMMWDFDPFYSNPTTYTVPAVDRTVVAYFAPLEYWKNHINTPAKGGVAYDDSYTYVSRPTVDSYELPDGSTTTAAGYVTTYTGDVHIYNENGLAWFISVVNGLNFTQAREFFFNKVYLHQKDGGYDMKDYKWSPVGNRQHPFRGWFQGVSSDVADTARLADNQYVAIKNIILNEPDMNNVGFFGFLDSARVYSIKLSGTMARGSEYVGAMAASSTHTQVQNCMVEGDAEGPSTTNTTILTTHYVSGGMIGESDHDRITNSSISAKYVGDAVYSGGVIGYGTSSTIANDHVRNDSRMRGLYVGGLAGYLDGTAPVNKGLFRKAKSGDMSMVRNNYVLIESNGNSQRVGGIVGRSANTVIENNYVYGMVVGSATDGAVGAVLNDGTRAKNNYYEVGSVKLASGQTSSGASVSSTASFEGSGNRVKIDQQVYGVNNLTRVLNIWVKEHNAAEGSEVYTTWRSDLDGVNHGYPIFGTPDMIPVEGSITVESCDTVEWEGIYYTADTSFSYNVIDSILMVDSTTALTVIVHHSTATSVSDTTAEGDGYSGYGFYLTPAETMLMSSTLDSTGAVTIVLSDTLSTTFGCDSVVTLNLTINANQGVTEVTRESTVKVYPNPTTSHVTIEATELKHVELYDNEGRRLADYVDAASDKLNIGLDHLPTGVYYLRIHTSEKVTIQKLIKK